MANVDLDISSLKNAIDSLERALAQEKNEFTRDSAIQRFEYTYELCWKFMQRCLQHEYDIDAVTLTKKKLFRECGRVGLIQDVENWFSFHEARNEVSHVYNEESAEAVYQVAKAFLPEATAFYTKLESIYND